MINDFTGGSFMETHYHSQFDNDSYYDEQVYRLHHELFTLLINALDHTAIVPLCFSPVFKRACEILDEDNDFIDEKISQKAEYLNDLLHTAKNKARSDYNEICVYNKQYRELQNAGLKEEAEALFQKTRPLEQRLLAQFKTEQDAFVRIDWYGNVLYPHEILLKNMKLVSGTIRNLKSKNISSALRKLYQLDNNAYAFMFDRRVYDHFSDYVFLQPRERLKWGYERLMTHENMYGIITSLLTKEAQKDRNCQEEIQQLNQIFGKQNDLLGKTLDHLYQTVTASFIL